MAKGKLKSRNSFCPHINAMVLALGLVIQLDCCVLVEEMLKIRKEKDETLFAASNDHIPKEDQRIYPPKFIKSNEDEET